MYPNLVYFCLLFLNFLHQIIDKTYLALNDTVNRCLENKVVYYALYSARDSHYACLYDCRTLWDRIWLVVQQILIWLKLEHNKLFSYADVDDNFETMSTFSIDVAIIVFIENGKMKEKMFIQNTAKKEQVQPPRHFKYIFGVAEDNQQNTLDLTTHFNTFQNNVYENKQLLCKDFVKLFAGYGKHRFDVNDLKCVRLMPDDTFTEVVFKDNDVIDHV